MKPKFDKFVDPEDIYSIIDELPEERSNKIDIVLRKMDKVESLLIKKIMLSDWSQRKAGRYLKKSKDFVRRKLIKAQGNFKVIYEEVFKNN